MLSVKRNTFAVGFLTAAAIWLVWFVVVNFRFQGVHVEDSPTGRYTLWMMSPMEPTVAGTYDITLRDRQAETTLRQVTVKLNRKEKTKSLRGLPVTMNWDGTESYVDISVDGTFLVRISVPPPVP